MKLLTFDLIDPIGPWNTAGNQRTAHLHNAHLHNEFMTSSYLIPLFVSSSMSCKNKQKQYNFTNEHVSFCFVNYS